MFLDQCTGDCVVYGVSFCLVLRCVLHCLSACAYLFLFLVVWLCVHFVVACMLCVCVCLCVCVLFVCASFMCFASRNVSWLVCVSVCPVYSLYSDSFIISFFYTFFNACLRHFVLLLFVSGVLCYVCCPGYLFSCPDHVFVFVCPVNLLFLFV